MTKKQSFADSLMRARHIHKNMDFPGVPGVGGNRMDKLEEVVSHLIFCLEEIQKNGKRLSEF